MCSGRDLRITLKLPTEPPRPATFCVSDGDDSNGGGGPNEDANGGGCYDGDIVYSCDHGDDLRGCW